MAIEHVACVNIATGGEAKIPRTALQYMPNWQPADAEPEASEPTDSEPAEPEPVEPVTPARKSKAAPAATNQGE